MPTYVHVEVEEDRMRDASMTYFILGERLSWSASKFGFHWHELRQYEDGVIGLVTACLCHRIARRW